MTDREREREKHQGRKIWVPETNHEGQRRNEIHIKAFVRIYQYIRMECGCPAPAGVLLTLTLIAPLRHFKSSDMEGC